MVCFRVKNRFGQSTVEYLMLTTAVLVVIAALVVKNGALAGVVNKTLTVPSTMINNANSLIKFQ